MPLFVVANPAAAQTALDRIDPVARGQAERKEPAPAAPVPHVQVEVERTAPSVEVTASSGITVGAIVLVGLQALHPADFADVLSERIGRTLGGDDLRALVAAIVRRTQDRGYALATAWIEPQRLDNGMLAVRVDEGRIDEIRFEGEADSVVREALVPLANGKPIQMGEIERRLLIAGDIGGARIRSSRFFRENGKGVLLVRATRERVSARLGVMSDGTRTLGPVQARIDVDVNALFADDDSFSLTFSGTPTEPGELGYVRARYSKRVSAGGTEVAVTGTASRAEPGAYLRSYKLESMSWSGGLSVLQPLWRRRDASLWLEGELGIRALQQRRAADLLRDDRTVTFRATLYGNAALAGGRFRFSTTLSQGLGVLGATGPRDPFASRFDADGTFTSLNSWADWTLGLGHGFSLRLAAQGQIASAPLLVSEEFGLGGTGFLRGYDWSERSGDQGYVGIAELRYMINRPFGLVRRAQLYAFVDGGKASNLDNGFGGGALASAGAGIRADVTNHLGANVEIAAPLTGPRYDTGTEAPKLRFRVFQSF
ncbi:MAG TPA: ShlB/FhaC/HecB family hemolysin secretion/activation protein [Sphingomonas sp.]|nr:ShlB/FhaC/HecB family hemolysin secretion/activation protein [Sphingomonas sp.]